MDNVFSLQYKKKKHEVTIGGGWTRYDGNHYGKIIWAQYGIDKPDYRWYDLDALKSDINIYAKWQYGFCTGLAPVLPICNTGMCSII